MDHAAWLHIFAAQFSPARRTSLSHLMKFLEISDVSDLAALDEQTLTFASTHKPQAGLPGHFTLMDICRFRQVLASCHFPNFSSATSAGIVLRQDPQSSTTSSTNACHTLRPSPCTINSGLGTVTITPPSYMVDSAIQIQLPSPSANCDNTLFLTPVAERQTRTCQWTLVKTIDLTELLNSHLGEQRLPSNGCDYYTNEWPIVVKLLWPSICHNTEFDCFWNWRDPTPVPQKLYWHKITSTFPPTGSTHFGVEYACDFVSICGCPKKLRVLRSPQKTSVFQLHINTVSPRHGCIHTIAKDKKRSTARKGEIPTLHPGLQAFLRRQSLNHDSTSPLTWGRYS